ncbi:unnamed protein product [Effrenium voratum]|nr:unnamed protein product [Effrenium voratum]
MQSSTWASQKMPSQTMGWQRLTQLVCTLELPYCLVFIASCRAARHRSLDYDHTPQLRKGIDVLPVHIAAEENSVFYLEQCGANPSCRSLLNAADARGDTPLHHAASHGAQQAAQALLRLGAEATRNRVGKFPEEVAQGPIAHLLAQSRGGTGGTRFASRHPDGLGVMQEPPPEAAVFTGLRHYDCLRQAVNMAAGCQIAPPLPVSREMRQNPSAAPSASLAAPDLAFCFTLSGGHHQCWHSRHGVPTGGQLGRCERRRAALRSTWQGVPRCWRSLGGSAQAEARLDGCLLALGSFARPIPFDG